MQDTEIEGRRRPKFLLFHDIPHPFMDEDTHSASSMPFFLHVNIDAKGRAKREFSKKWYTETKLKRLDDEGRRCRPGDPCEELRTSGEVRGIGSEKILRRRCDDRSGPYEQCFDIMSSRSNAIDAVCALRDS